MVKSLKIKRSKIGLAMVGAYGPAIYGWLQPRTARPREAGEAPKKLEENSRLEKKGLICFAFNLGVYKNVLLKFNLKTMVQEEKLARYAKALAHPARLVILRFLNQSCTCFAGNLAEQVELAASTVSQHLKVLKEAGLIQGNVEGINIRYCINRKNWQEARLLFKEFFT